MSALFTNLPIQNAPERPRGRGRRYTRERFEQVAAPVAVIDPEEHLRQLARRPRRCMSGISDECQDRGRMFDSEHSGHRVCDDCKGSSIWSGPLECTVSAAF